LGVDIIYQNYTKIEQRVEVRKEAAKKLKQIGQGKIGTRGRQIRSGHLSYLHQVTSDLRELIGKGYSMETQVLGKQEEMI
jgi:hypothetical protein